MKFPYDITHEFRAAQKRRARKLLLAKAGLIAGCLFISPSIGMLAAISPAYSLVALVVLSWAAWGLIVITRS